jgi:HAD superfamily hydrolase (TIGR01450 family)
MELGAIDLFLFDIDGVFLAGKGAPRLVSGRRILAALRARGRPYRLVTNTSTDGPGAIAAGLRDHGLPVDAADITSAIDVAVAETARRFPGQRCLVFGEEGLRAAVAAAGLEPCDDAPAAVVLVGLTRFAGYRQLSAAARCLRGGAVLLGCHRNKMWIDDGGPSISVGPWLAALEFATGARAETFGKPAPAFFLRALAVHGEVAPDRVMMVGDDLVADIRGARQLGMQTALVLTGKTGRDALVGFDPQPDLVLDQVDDLVDRL